MIKPELQVGSHLSGVTVIWQLWKKTNRPTNYFKPRGNALNIMRWISSWKWEDLWYFWVKQVPTLFKYRHHEHVNSRLNLNDLIFQLRWLKRPVLAATPPGGALVPPTLSDIGTSAQTSTSASIRTEKLKLW